jgi:glycyl-tRNA synthetase beta chain
MLGAILSEAASSGMFSEATRARVAEAKALAPAWLPLVEQHDPSISDDLRVFLQDRLKVYLRDKGVRHDIIDAVLTPDSCNFVTIVQRVEALGALLSSDDGKNLLAGTKRAANILAAEEKKGTAVAAAVDASLFRLPAEESLFAAVNRAESDAAQAIAGEDFAAAMLALSGLREPVDAFFDQVLVNDEDAAVRANRLALLARIRAATGQVADFSRIAG